MRGSGQCSLLKFSQPTINPVTTAIHVLRNMYDALQPLWLVSMHAPRPPMIKTAGLVVGFAGPSAESAISCPGVVFGAIAVVV